jgi:hypothetical protein
VAQRIRWDAANRRAMRLSAHGLGNLAIAVLAIAFVAILLGRLDGG